MPSPQMARRLQSARKTFVPPPQVSAVAPMSTPNDAIAVQENAKVPPSQAQAVLNQGEELQFASLDNVPTDLSTAQAGDDGANANVVILITFVSQRTDFIIQYLGLNFVQDYEQISHEFGVFDYMAKRKKNIGNFNKALAVVGMHFKTAQTEIIAYIEKFYSACLHETESYRQLVCLSKYFINLYLNYLGCSRDF